MQMYHAACASDRFELKATDAASRLDVCYQLKGR